MTARQPQLYNAMMTTKEKAREVIDRLPDEASLDEIAYALYVAAKFERGQSQIDAGRGIDHEQVKSKLREKWSG